MPSLEPRFPEGGDDFRRVEPVHLIERGRQHECVRSRVAVEDGAEPEPVVPVCVGDLHRGQVLPVGGDPVGETVRLIQGQQRVDKNRVPVAADKSCRNRRKQPLPGTWGKIRIDGRLRLCHVDVPGRRGYRRCRRRLLSGTERRGGQGRSLSCRPADLAFRR